MSSITSDLLKGLDVPFEIDAPLAPWTWYRLGGPARLLVRPSDVDQLSTLVSRCRQSSVPMYVLGRGANLLVADEGVDGVVVCLNAPSFTGMQIEQHLVTVGAGYDLMRLVQETAKAGLGGLECLAGIPATVGGAVRMNAGGSFGDIGQNIARVQVMDDTAEVYHRDRDDLIFGYRSSNILARFILGVEFELTPEPEDELVRRVKEIFFYKKNSQPMGDRSPGCAFKNPPESGQPAAGQLIDQCGLKGYRVGGAVVSDRHANFVIADPEARAADVVAVLEHVERTVADRLGIQLEREVVLWP